MPKDESDDPSKLGRAPDAALVMDNNLGTAPGPERKRQVLSALNQNKRGQDRLNFHLASIDLLTLWKMGGDKQEQQAAVVIGSRIRMVESKRHTKIPRERVDFIARTCKVGIKNAEKVQHLTKQKMTALVEQQLANERLWPP